MSGKKDKIKEVRRFLNVIREDGIEEIYIAPKVSEKSENLKTADDFLKQDEGKKEILLQLKQQALQCTLCDELVRNRTNVVFGSGNINAQLMFVGEAPGRDEDLQGLPFVGRAGQLLTKIIESIGFDRKQVFIANTLKCRPPQNRPPKPDELLNCEHFLKTQIEQIQPKIICALGTYASQAVLKTEEPISKLRGKFHDYVAGIRVMCTYHPAYLLRNPGEKRKVWEDMKLIKKELDALE